MNKLENLHDVSSFYFFVLSLTYVFLVLAFRNGFLAEFLMNVMRILDTPFALVSLIYGGSTLALQLDLEKKDGSFSPWVLVIFVGCLLLFGIVMFINYAFPSSF